jgi:hypothetical protein
MSTTLAIIGGIVIVLGASAKIPHAVATLIRACIPMIKAFYDLRRAIRAGSADTGNSTES